MHKRNLLLAIALVAIPTSVAGFPSPPADAAGMLKSPVHPEFPNIQPQDVNGDFFFGVYVTLPDTSVTYTEPAPITSDIVCSTEWTHSTTKSGTTLIDYSINVAPPVRPDRTYQILGSYTQGWIRLTATNGAEETVDQYRCPGTWEVVPFVDAKVNTDPQPASVPSLPAHWTPLYFTSPVNVAPRETTENAIVENHWCFAVVFKAKDVTSLNTPFTRGIRAVHRSDTSLGGWDFFTIIAGKQFSLFKQSSPPKSDVQCFTKQVDTVRLENAANKGEINRPDAINQPPMGGWSIEWYTCDGKDTDVTRSQREATCKSEWATVVVSA